MYATDRPQGEVRAAEQEFAPAAAAPKRTKMNRRKRNEYIWGWVFITPLTVGFLLFTAFPLVLSIFYSFTSYDLFHAPEWIWFDNFIEIFTSPTDWFLESLVNALIYHCGADHLCNVQGEDDRLGIVHRLDRDTSGLMLAAKTDAAGYALMEDIRDRAVDRHYLALVHGVIAPDTGMIDAPIARSANERTRMAVRDVPSARDAVTTFRVLERFEPRQHDDGYTLIDCKLFTGRTHQIRVHMQYAKHPLVGDPVYTANGPKDARAQLGLKRQFLHSFRVRFTHPETSEELEFADNLPRDLDEALRSLGDRSRGMTDAGREVAALLADAPRPSVEGELLE